MLWKMKCLGGSPHIIFDYVAAVAFCYWAVTLVLADAKVSPNSGKTK